MRAKMAVLTLMRVMLVTRLTPPCLKATALQLTDFEPFFMNFSLFFLGLMVSDDGEPPKEVADLKPQDPGMSLDDENIQNVLRGPDGKGNQPKPGHNEL